jgi:hypothetical protein
MVEDPKRNRTGIFEDRLTIGSILLVRTSSETPSGKPQGVESVPSFAWMRERLKNGEYILAFAAPFAVDSPTQEKPIKQDERRED